MTERTIRESDGSLAKAIVWMVGLSLVLFWLPVLGPLIAGIVGGRIAGTTGRAVIAAIIPALALGGLVTLVLVLFELPVIGALAGFGVALAVLVQDIPMIAGAVLAAPREEGA